MADDGIYVNPKMAQAAIFPKPEQKQEEVIDPSKTKAKKFSIIYKGTEQEFNVQYQDLLAKEWFKYKLINLPDSLIFLVTYTGDKKDLEERIKKSVNLVC